VPPKIDKTGKHYGRLTVTGEAARNRHGHILWRCVCACGNSLEVEGCRLTSGRTRSCGCLRVDSKALTRLTHGESKRGKWSPEYRAWVNMKTRCFNPNNHAYHNYGARGITLDDRWLTFNNFLADMGRKPSPELTLERVDNAGNYAPGNCVWATYTDQCNNTRHNVFFEFAGHRLTLPQWARKLGVPLGTLRTRLNRGWSVERTLNKENKCIVSRT
jgi:hypothetical protein